MRVEVLEFVSSFARAIKDEVRRSTYSERMCKLVQPFHFINVSLRVKTFREGYCVESRQRREALEEQTIKCHWDACGFAVPFVLRLFPPQLFVQRNLEEQVSHLPVLVLLLGAQCSVCGTDTSTIISQYVRCTSMVCIDNTYRYTHTYIYIYIQRTREATRKETERQTYGIE